MNITTSSAQSHLRKDVKLMLSSWDELENALMDGSNDLYAFDTKQVANQDSEGNLFEDKGLRRSNFETFYTKGCRHSPLQIQILFIKTTLVPLQKQRVVKRQRGIISGKLHGTARHYFQVSLLHVSPMRQICIIL